MELLLVAAAAGFVVWLIMRRNQPAPTPNGVAPAVPRARSGGPGFIGWLLIIAVDLRNDGLGSIVRDMVTPRNEVHA